MSAPISILLLTQRRHGESLIEAAAHFIGEKPKAVAVSLLGNESRGEIESHLEDAIAGLGDCDILVLCDLYGATHASIAAALARKRKNVACVSGLNIAMLMEAHTSRGRSLPEAAARAAKAGKKSVAMAGAGCGDD